VIPARFHAAALEELEAEVSYYTEISPMLGEGLLRSVEQALQLACEFPEMARPTSTGLAGYFQRDSHSRWCTCIGTVKFTSSRWHRSDGSPLTGSAGPMRDNLSIDEDQQQQAAASPLALVARSSSR
jgi:hypothetical protein